MYFISKTNTHDTIEIWRIFSLCVFLSSSIGPRNGEILITTYSHLHAITKLQACAIAFVDSSSIGGRMTANLTFTSLKYVSLPRTAGLDQKEHRIGRTGPLYQMLLDLNWICPKTWRKKMGMSWSAQTAWKHRCSMRVKMAASIEFAKNFLS